MCACAENDGIHRRWPHTPTTASWQVSGVSAPRARAAAPEPWPAGAREFRAAGGAAWAAANGAGAGGRQGAAPGVRGPEAEKVVETDDTEVGRTGGRGRFREALL